MQSKIPGNKFINKLPLILTLIGIAIYAAQSIYYALYQVPVMDEGAYLIKGYQFALGNFKPFQPYGFWTNKMVLGFYIWGWIQAVFSPGLLAPRLFAVVFGILTLIGTWLIIKRLANKWLAALAVWTFALNPYLISNYSWAVSQVLVICMLTWILFLVLRQDAPLGIIIAASVLSVVMVFTRENMIFFLPLFILFVFWQHGKTKGFYSIGVILFLFLLGHVLFWPGILYLWERWLPDLTSLFVTNTSSASGSGGGVIDLLQRILSLATALRVFLIPLLGSLFTLVFWPRKKDWISDTHKKSVIFLLVTYAILLIAHIYASTGLDYCVFCTTQYFEFFGSLGVILFAISYASIKHEKRNWQIVVSAILFVVVFTVVGFSLFERIGYLLNNIQLPRIGEGKILPGTAMLWQILANKFGFSLEASRRLLPTLLGLLFGILFVVILIIVSNRLSQRYGKSYLSYFFPLLFLPLFIFLPFINFLPENSLCITNVPEIYQSMANKIKVRIEPGDRIFVDGSLTNIPLIYISPEYYFPPQVNEDFSFRKSENTDELLQMGYWNQELRDQWFNESEFFIIGTGKMSEWEDEQVDSHRIFSMGRYYSGECPAEANIYIFSRDD